MSIENKIKIGCWYFFYEPPASINEFDVICSHKHPQNDSEIAEQERHIKLVWIENKKKRTHTHTNDMKWKQIEKRRKKNVNKTWNEC